MLTTAIFVITAAMPAPTVEKVGPVMVQVVTKDQIENLPNPRNASEVIKAIVSYKIEGQVVAEQTNAVTQPRNIIMRAGMDPYYVLIDGIQVIQASTILTNDALSNIEVILGGTESLYGMPRTRGILSQGYKTLLDDINSNRQEVRIGVNLRPAGWTEYKLDLHTWNVRLNYDFKKEIRFPDDSELATQSLGKWTVPMGTWQRPVRTPNIIDTFFPDEQVFGGDNPFGNRIGGIKFTDEYEGKFDTFGLTIPWRPFIPKNQAICNVDNYLADVSNQYGSQLTSKLMLRSGLGMTNIKRMMNGAAAQGESMNWLNFPGNPDELGPVNCGSTVSFPTGTLWQPDRQGYQTMSTIENFSYTFPKLFAGIGYSELALARMRAQCLNMEQKEPGKDVKYFPYFCSDPILRAIMQLSSQASLRGPWLQARTWIYTDKATLSEINDRLIPGISPGRYVDELFEVAKLGGLTDKDLANPKMFNPILLAGSTASESSLGWFVRVLANKHSKITRAWLEKAPQEMQSLVSGSSPLDILHLQRLFGMLFISESADIRIGGMACLSKNKSLTVALKGKIPPPSLSLESEDVKEVEIALSCLEQCYDSMPKYSLTMLSKFGATDSIKSRATAILSR